MRVPIFIILLASFSALAQDWQDMPQELLDAIFSRCDLADLGRCASVSKAFFHYIMNEEGNEQIWKHQLPGFGHKELADDSSLNFLRAYKKVEKSALKRSLRCRVNAKLHLSDSGSSVIPHKKGINPARRAKKRFLQGNYEEALVAFNHIPIDSFDEEQLLLLADSLFYSGQKAEARAWYGVLFATLGKKYKNSQILLESVKKGKHAKSELLLHAGAFVDAVDSTWGSTALMFAAQNQDFLHVILLIKHGANKYFPSPKHSKRPFDFVLDKIAIEVLRAFIEAGVQVDARDNIWGSTALMFAAQQANGEAVRYLIAKGAQLDLLSLSQNLTAYDFAMQHICVDVLQAFFDHGVQVDARDSKYGSTALMFAAQQGNITAIKYLLAQGADKNLVSLAGESRAYDFAKIKGIRKLLK